MPVIEASRLVSCMAGTVIAIVAGWHACAFADPPVQPELEAVHEMLKLDAERALAAERARSPAPPPARAAVRAPDRIELASIYGMRGRLSAVVVVNGEPRLYRQGSEWPRGGTGSSQYRLIRIEDGCVHLAKAGARERAACFPLEPGTGAAEPMAQKPPLPRGLPIIPGLPNGSSLPPLPALVAPLDAAR
jgi:hypothetical protein